MKFTVITAFENMFDGPMSLGLVGSAVQKSLIQLSFINPRKFTEDVHQSIDDRPFGGGDGMLMSISPLLKSIEEYKKASPKGKVVYLSPQGKSFDQKKAAEFKGQGDVCFLCGRYAGVDERLVSKYVDEEVSLGDFVLSGAEIASMAMIDAVARLVPGVLGNQESYLRESFEANLLEWPQFTRPREFEGLKVPDILLSGDHKKIEEWRKSLGILRTLDRRPELLEGAKLSESDLDKAFKCWLKMSDTERKACGLGDLGEKFSSLGNKT